MSGWCDICGLECVGVVPVEEINGDINDWCPECLAAEDTTLVPLPQGHDTERGTLG